MTTSFAMTVAARFEPELRDALMEAFAAMKGRITPAVIEEALLNRGATGVMDLMSSIEGDFGPFKEKLNDAWVASGRVAIKAVPQEAVMSSVWSYSPFAEGSAQHLRTYELNLIQQISHETREGVRQGLQADLVSGRNPKDTARAFRDNLGLTRRQEQAVRNYRRSLENLQGEALERALRDKRFDRTILSAIKNQKPLSSDQVDKMVNRYREKYIAYRAETIARTEAMRATTEGTRDSMAQMIKDQAVNTELFRRFWVNTADGRTRDAHRAIPAMNSEGVAFDEPYKTPLGPLMYPRDPNGSAANTIDCRCTERFELIGAL